MTAAAAPRPLPSGMPVRRHSLCQLARPCLATAQHTPRFLFQDSSLLWITDGQLVLEQGRHRLVAHAADTLVLVEAGTSADLHKSPGGLGPRFRSLFLSLDAAVLEAFQRHHPQPAPTPGPQAPFRALTLDSDVAATLQHVAQSLEAGNVSDARLQHRLLDLLCALDERGHGFGPAASPSTTQRLRALLGATPQQRWTAAQAGQALAMSEATLRRRLAREQQRFEALLADVRMQHALVLLQTTGWGIPRIALACGYQSRARFAQRFQGRFGYLPSAVR